MEPVMPWTQLISICKQYVGTEPHPIGSAHNLHFKAGAVFVKATRVDQDGSGLMREILMADYLNNQGISTPKPFYPHVISTYDDEGRKRYITLWNWLNPHHLSNERTIQETCSLVSRLHTVPPLKGTPALNISAFVDEVNQRLSSPVLKEYFEWVKRMQTIMETISPSFLDDLPTLLIHGDPHPFNTMKDPGGDGICLIDWEDSCIGPKEWDLAQLYRYNKELDSIQLFSDFVSIYGADDDALRRTIVLRDISSMSFLLLTGDRPPIFYATARRLGLMLKP